MEDSPLFKLNEVLDSVTPVIDLYTASVEFYGEENVALVVDKPYVYIKIKKEDFDISYTNNHGTTCKHHVAGCIIYFRFSQGRNFIDLSIGLGRHKLTTIEYDYGFLHPHVKRTRKDENIAGFHSMCLGTGPLNNMLLKFIESKDDEERKILASAIVINVNANTEEESSIGTSYINLPNIINHKIVSSADNEFKASSLTIRNILFFNPQIMEGLLRLVDMTKNHRTNLINIKLNKESIEYLFRNLTSNEKLYFFYRKLDIMNVTLDSQVDRNVYEYDTINDIEFKDSTIITPEIVDKHLYAEPDSSTMNTEIYSEDVRLSDTAKMIITFLLEKLINKYIWMTEK